MNFYGSLVLTLLIMLVALVAWGKIERQWVGLFILLVLILSGAVAFSKVLMYVDWNVLGLILGMSIMTIYLEKSGLMDLVTKSLERFLKSPISLVFWLSLLAGSISIFLENVTVVLLMAPIALRLARKHGLDPAHVLIPIALASNMAGSATMVGDPPAIITAGYFNIAFMDFIYFKGKPSMFFFTLIPMILACSSIAFLTAKAVSPSTMSNLELNALLEERKTLNKAFLFEATGFLLLKIVLLSLRHQLHLSLGVIALISVSGLTIVRLIHRDLKSVKESLIEGFEWRLILFLIGVFVLSGAFAEHGLAEAIALKMVKAYGGDVFLITTLLVWISVAISAFIDNVPYIVTMLPIIEIIARSLSVEPISIAWAVLLGTTLGGNLTYIGASANVTAVRILERHGYRVSFFKFIRTSIPFNTISVVTGWALYEAFWILQL